MRIIILKDAEQVAATAARIIQQQVQGKPTSVLGLATGGTPVATYRKLVELHRQGLDLSLVTTFNLDEYVGLEAESPQSYRAFMNQHLFEPAGIPLQQTHVLNGMARDLVAECREFESRIVEAGGIDLQLLGIGRDGHIGFNEPSSSLVSRTRWMLIAPETVQDNAHYFGGIEQMPKGALTMGVGTIMDARSILLLATGTSKAEAVQAMIEGPITSQVTATALQMHPHAIVVLDELAATRLKRREYYQNAERMRESVGL